MARILIVDDSAEFRKMVAVILQRAEHEALQAEGGQEALHMAIIEQPDLILLDYMMPEMNGFEVFAELRENSNTKHIPVIMITAYSTSYEQDRDDALRHGLDDYMTKPISHHDLTQRITDMLHLRDLNARGRG